MKRSSASSKAVSGSTQKSVDPQPTPSPVLKEPVQKSADAPAAPKRQKKESTKVKEESKATDKLAPETTVPVSLAPAVEEHLEAELTNTPADEFEVRCVEYFNALKDLVNKISDLKNEYKAIERVWVKRFKSVSKSGGKKKKKTGTRAPSGFVKPTLISDELATFLGRAKGTEMARTEVTREINVYIRNNKLQDSQNGRKINADPALSSLLKLNVGDELTYFNLQKYMSGHFPKAVAPVVV
jgi:chromatin remodeling complex protein RSC6